MRLRFLFEWLLIAALLPLVLLWANDRPGLGDINRMLYDQVLRADPRGAPSTDVVVIGIDERSITALGAWPWPRTIHARLLDQLAPHAPRNVMFNVFFDKPGPREDDALLAAAMSKLPVYLPMDFGVLQAGTSKLAPLAVCYTPPILAAAARGIGHVNANADSDDRVRSLFPLRGHGRTAGALHRRVGRHGRARRRTGPAGLRTPQAGGHACRASASVWPGRLAATARCRMSTFSRATFRWKASGERTCWWARWKTRGSTTSSP